MDTDRVFSLLLFWMIFPDLDNFHSIFWQTKDYFILIYIFDWTATFIYCHVMTSIQLYLKGMRRLKTHMCSPRFLGFFKRVLIQSALLLEHSGSYHWSVDQIFATQKHGVTIKWLYGMTRNDRVKSKKEDDRVKAEYWDVLWFFPRCKGRLIWSCAGGSFS